MEQQKYGDSRAGRDGGTASEMEEPMMGRAAQCDDRWGVGAQEGTQHLCPPPTQGPGRQMSTGPGQPLKCSL